MEELDLDDSEMDMDDEDSEMDMDDHSEMGDSIERQSQCWLGRWFWF